MMLRNGLAAAGQLLVTDLRSLPGTVGVTNASASVPTTVDLTQYVKAGDYISFANQGGTIYGIASITSTTITLAQNFSGTTNASTTALKESFVIPSGAPSPLPSAGAGTAGVTNASTAVSGVGTSYNTLFAAGDAFFISGDTQVYRIASVTSATALVLTTQYQGSTGTGKTYYRSNYSNEYGRFGAMAIGTASTAAANTDTGLGAEITTNGGGRRSGSNVVTYLASVSGGWKSGWKTTWTFTGGFFIFELMVCNDAVAGRGIALLRQVFAAAFVVVNTDLLNLDVSVSHTASGTSTGIVPDIGLKEAAKLLMDPTTTLQVGSTWDTNQGTTFDSMAFGTGSTAPAAGDVTLQTELATSGATRQTGNTGGTNGTGITGQIMRNPAGVLGDQFTTDTSTVFAGDTIQFRCSVTFTGTQAVREQGIFNGSNTANGDPASGSRMLVHEVFAADQSFIATDIYIPVIRVQQQ